MCHTSSLLGAGSDFPVHHMQSLKTMLNKPLFQWSNNSLRPSNIRLFSAAEEGLIGIHTQVKWLCSRHRYLSALALIWPVNFCLFSCCNVFLSTQTQACHLSRNCASTLNQGVTEWAAALKVLKTHNQRSKPLIRRLRHFNRLLPVCRTASCSLFLHWFCVCALSACDFIALCSCVCPQSDQKDKQWKRGQLAFISRFTHV